MKVSTTILALSAALGATALPSHAHGHAHAHQRRDFVVANKPVVSTKVVAENAAPTAPAKSKVDDKVAKIQSTGEKVPFCAGKRSTAEENEYGGNTGSTYGCNMMEVDNDIADLYNNRFTFVNKADSDSTCVCFNKVGADGKMTGFFKDAQIVNLNIPVGGSKTVVLDDGTIGGCACALGSDVPTTSYGAWASTWIEFEVASLRNGGFSGADVSILTSCSENKQDILAMKLTRDGDDTTSWVKKYTSSEGPDAGNAYVCGTEGHDGIGFNVGPGKPMHMTVTLGDF